MEEALIQYKNVEIHQQELCVLSDVNLELHKGEFVYLIGKVGSGENEPAQNLLRRTGRNRRRSGSAGL